MNFGARCDAGYSLIAIAAVRHSLDDTRTTLSGIEVTTAQFLRGVIDPDVWLLIGAGFAVKVDFDWSQSAF